MPSDLKPPKRTVGQWLIKTLSYLVGAFVALCLLAMAIVAYFMTREWGSGETFDAAKWHNIDPMAFGTECPRGEMYADLKRHHLQPGTAKSAVLALLGKPDDDPLLPGSCIGYNLGMCALVDTVSLDICFDESERVISVEHHQH